MCKTSVFLIIEIITTVRQFTVLFLCMNKTLFVIVINRFVVYV